VNNNANTAKTLGIVALVTLLLNFIWPINVLIGGLAGTGAVIMGFLGLSYASANDGDGRSAAIGGMVMGILAMVGHACLTMLSILIIGIMLANM
jgi:hypothetical protein